MKYLLNTLKVLLFYISFALSSGIYAQTPVQIEVLTPADDELGYNADTLKAWILNILDGNGGLIDTSTIRFTGNYQAFGKFFDGVDLGFDKGLIISTGKVLNAEGPNSSGLATDVFNEFSLDPNDPQSGDDDLLKMYNIIFTGMGGKDTLINYTGDAAALEFSYQPYGDQIMLDYVFASEEYPSSNFPANKDVNLTGFNGQGSNSQIFDLFGISIEKLNFKNLAFMMEDSPTPTPEANRWITVQSVNEGSNSSYYSPNPFTPPFGQPVVLGTQFDALTKVNGDLGPLKVQKKEVDRCAKYKVKIVIEDFYWNSPDPDQLPHGFQINSAVLLGEKSLISSDQLTNVVYSNWKVDYEFTNQLFIGDLIENCNDIIATFTLDNAVIVDYSIPYKIIAENLSSKVEVSYQDGPIITNDSITFLAGETEKIIVIKAVNLDQNHTNVAFKYPKNPCDLPGLFGGGFVGKISFNLIDNKPITFTANPKIYEAYCKESIDLTITDVTNNGINPLSYYWNGDIISNEIINYQVQSSPDLVNILVKDGCANESNAQVQINNKPVVLQPILDALLCGTGQSISVPVFATMPNYSDYTIDHVKWWKVGTPNIDLGDAPGNEMLVEYDDVVGDDIWTCGFEITDCCGGKATGTFSVNQSELTLGDDITICNGEDRLIVANAAAQSFEWFATNAPGVILSTINTVLVSPSVTTEYTLRIKDMCDVIQEATITVNVDLFVPEITINPASAEVCPGEPVTLTANTALEWNWEPGGENTQSITINNIVPDTYEYTLTASSEFCFDKTTSATFEVFPTPVANFNFNPDADACTGESIIFNYLDVVTNETFEWTFGDGSPVSNLTNPTHTYLTAGVYNVLLHVDKYICENDTSVEITVNPLPSPDFDADVIDGCLPVEVVFTDGSSDIAPSAVYEWTFGDGSLSNDNGNTAHTYTQAGLYDVSLTINNTQRCAQTVNKPKYISANPNPKANFEADPYITTLDTPTIEFDDLSISDSTISNYEWIFGDGDSNSDNGNTSHTYTQPGDYQVQLRIETINGCWDTISSKVALTEDVKLFIPNAFTPNNDGVNDVFLIKGTPIADFNLYIYDRWGKNIWSTHNYEIKWDGTTKDGNKVNSGTYIYQITGTDYKKQAVNFKGSVTVIR